MMFQEVAPRIRRALTKRFPYGLYYQVEADMILVLGIFHSSRDPKVWKRRVRKGS